jgi:hypothetical protein
MNRRCNAISTAMQAADFRQQKKARGANHGFSI